MRGPFRGTALTVDLGRSRAAVLSAPDNGLLGSAATVDDPVSGINALVQHEEIAGHRGLLGGFQAAKRIDRGTRAAAGPGHHMPSPHSRRELGLGSRPGAK